MVVLIFALHINLLYIEVLVGLPYEAREHAVAGSVEDEALNIPTDIWKSIPKLEIAL